MKVHHADLMLLGIEDDDGALFWACRLSSTTTSAGKAAAKPTETFTDGAGRGMASPLAVLAQAL